MALFSFHLAETTLAITFRALFRPPTPKTVEGLRGAECMTVMKLGAPIISPSRAQFRRLAVFAAWEDDSALQAFLTNTRLGESLSNGWHVRLQYLRRWGRVASFDDLPKNNNDTDPEAPVVAFTLARMKLPQVPRFIHWGRPVEQLVRDHPKQTLALAAIRLPRTVSTFSVWKTQRDMTDMVRGQCALARPDRHAIAMKERSRKDFHFEFTTLRFRALKEEGTWLGQSSIVPSEFWPITGPTNSDG